MKHISQLIAESLCQIQRKMNRHQKKKSKRILSDKHTLLCVADAFDKLCNIYAYKKLPSNYPYKKLIAELSEKVVSMAKRERDEKTFSFTLSLHRKAQLAAVRYDMLHTVRSIKFSELDFTEEQNNNSTQMSTTDTFSDEEKTEPKKWRAEFEAWKRKRNNVA